MNALPCISLDMWINRCWLDTTDGMIVLMEDEVPSFLMLVTSIEIFEGFYAELGAWT
jgi:hypothetical protein